MKASSVLVFDMDGVLAEVSDSYIATIVATVQHFTGRTVSRGLIEQFKQAGGWNNDWALSHKLIVDEGGADVSYQEVVSVFQSFFLGANSDGFITREKWIPSEDLLPRLALSHALALFTGRPRAEIELTLARFVPNIRWQTIVADEDVAKAKPAPDGLQAIAAAHPASAITYIGDNIDDARSASVAGVSFIGVAGADQKELIRAFRDEGASAIIGNINEIEGVL